MKTLSDLKKTLSILGREVEMLSYDGHTPPEKLRGTRQVVKIQTNGVYLAHSPDSKTRSWFDFPKASELEIHTTKHFTITSRTKAGDVWNTREYLIKN